MITRINKSKERIPCEFYFCSSSSAFQPGLYTTYPPHKVCHWIYSNTYRIIKSSSNLIIGFVNSNISDGNRLRCSVTNRCCMSGYKGHWTEGNNTKLDRLHCQMRLLESLLRNHQFSWKYLLKSFPAAFTLFLHIISVWGFFSCHNCLFHSSTHLSSCLQLMHS